MKIVRRVVKLLGLEDDEGQGVIEYGLIIGLVTLLAFISYTNFGTSTSNMINKVADSVSSIS